MNQIDLNGRVAVVTGGASGLGLATAQRFLASGARVTIWDRDEDRVAQVVADLAPLGDVAGTTVDIGDAAAVERGMAVVQAREGRIDIVVNSAGISGLSCPSDEVSLDLWDQQMRVNLSGAFYVCRAAIPHMKANGHGRIILVASAAGKDGNPQQAPYSAAKAGVIGLTKSLGKELGPFGIMVNCIAPTIFETPMHEVSKARLGVGLMDAIKAKIPLGRAGRPDEFAAMAAWLASDECSYTTGFVFDLTGGRSTY
ncbi:SDR family NAD(P)-dependent oxidoreductase [Sphingobium sp. HBC34]|uniref:SDR family NAD(P)-dependent oxidoreductase n=1 Tax=Sphingobium cyanobacteriorum TaxID=3063954 RepID=A0ABT8ZPA6_9SPHN|nr:SDR family NAD(P)-dependent oxidoreductase [Sphingobium sp. HBC34]MDO7836367.1 SDR family NAD(P)-dependent oxidoreductase [Sphingobium sp. HBC34]